MSSKMGFLKAKTHILYRLFIIKKALKFFEYIFITIIVTIYKYNKDKIAKWLEVMSKVRLEIEEKIELKIKSEIRSQVKSELNLEFESKLELEIESEVKFEIKSKL